MANTELAAAVKSIIGLARSGRLDDAYLGYSDLFASPAFQEYRTEDQRQALRLMVHAKNAPSPATPPMIEAHRSAIVPLTSLVSLEDEPGDYEMLGICHALVGNEQAAASIFRVGLQLERDRSPQSDLCGALMKRISML